jgi:hypothetical protein
MKLHHALARRRSGDEPNTRAIEANGDWRSPAEEHHPRDPALAADWPAPARPSEEILHDQIPRPLLARGVAQHEVRVQQSISGGRHHLIEPEVAEVGRLRRAGTLRCSSDDLAAKSVRRVLGAQVAKATVGQARGEIARGLPVAAVEVLEVAIGEQSAASATEPTQ